MNHKGLKGGGERFPQKPESSIISSGADAVISLSHYVEGCVESKHCTNPRDTTAKQKLLGSNKLTDCLLASIHLFVGKKKHKTCTLQSPLRFGWRSCKKRRLRFSARTRRRSRRSRRPPPRPRSRTSSPGSRTPPGR